MAKKRTKGKKNPGTQSKNRPKSVTDLTDTYETLYTTWNDFSENMESRISENIEHQQKTYEDFYNKWMKFNEKFGNRIIKTQPGHKYREAYDIWRNYSNRLNHRLTKMMSKGKSSYEKLDKYWQDYYKYWNDEFGKVASGKLDPSDFKNVYDAWAGFTGEMQEYIQSTTDLSTEEMEELTQIWYDFSEKMRGYVVELTEDGEEYEEIADLWTDTSKEIGHGLKTMLKKSNGDYKKLNKTWYDYYSKMEKRIIDASQSLGVDYDDLWKYYFDNQRAWYGWWSRSLKQDNNDLKSQLKELQKRVESLEKRQKN